MSGGWTKADVDRVNLKQAIARAPKSKYRNVKVTIDGQTFHSKHEADLWMALKARQHAGEIWNLTRQIRWPLHAPLHGKPGALVQVAEYISDFEWDESNRHVVADAKGGAATQIFALKRKWLLLEHGIEILEMR